MPTCSPFYEHLWDDALLMALLLFIFLIGMMIIVQFHTNMDMIVDTNFIMEIQRVVEC